VNHRYRRRALIAAPLLLVLAACTRESPPPPLRIAVNVWPGYDTLWLAEQLGFTAAEGVAVRILTTDGLGASRRLLKLGEADLIGGTLVELIASSAYDGCAPRAISLLNVSLGPDVILARPGINGVAELRGRRVGIEPGTSDLLLLAAALRAGEVDAVCTYPPEAEETVRATGARRIFSSADAPGAIIDVLIADAATVRARGRELAALLRANQRALDALRTDPAARRLFARRGGVTEEELARQLAGLELPRLSSQPARFGPGGTVRLATEGAIRALRDYGALTRDIPAAELLEPAVLREALNPR